MVQIKILCKHYDGVPVSVQLDDYYPLTKAEIKELLDMAVNDNNPSQIQCRLNQGIRGIKCPRVDDPNDRASVNEIKMNRLFVRRSHEGGTPELVDAFDKLLNWE